MSDMSKFKVGANTYDIKDEKSRGVPLTWAQYQALSYEEQHNGTAYYITDMDAIYPVDHELNANSRNAVANDIVTPHILAMENVLGAKNVLTVSLEELKALNTAGTWSGNTYTYGDVAYTLNDDKSISVVGQSSGLSALYIRRRLSTETYKDMLLNGCEGGGSSSYCLRAQFYDPQDAQAWNDEYVYDENDVVIDDTYPNFSVTVIVYSGTTVNTTIKPMIRPAGTDPTYVKHAMTNAELTERIVVVSGSVTTDSSGYANLGQLGFWDSDWLYVTAVVVDDTARAHVWNSSAYGWIITLYELESFTRKTNFTADIIVFGIKRI